LSVKYTLHMLSAVAVIGAVSASAWADDGDEELPLAPKQILQAGNGEFGFGGATATYGDRVVVGQHWHAFGGTKAGSVSLFSRVVSQADPNRPWNWVKSGTLVPTTGDWSHSWFGSTLDLNGSTVLVGAPRWDEGVDPGDVPADIVDCGAAWIFDAAAAESDGGLTLPIAALTINDLHVRDYFGCDVAIDGDTAIVGAWGHDLDPAVDDNTGAAFVFERQNDATWTHVATLQPPVAQPNGRFGMVVAVDGDHILVGAPWAFTYSGVVHVYTRVGDVWQWSQQIDNPGTPHARFGSSLALAVGVGDDLSEGGFIAGGPGDGAAGPQAGRAWGFSRTAGGAFVTSPDYEFLPPDAAAGDEIGASLVVVVVEDDDGDGDDDGDNVVVIVGAPGASGGTGRVDVFDFEADTVQWIGAFLPSSADAIRFGHSIAVGIADLPEWDESMFRAFLSAPGNGAVGLGEIDVYELVLGDANGDCDEDGVWDFLQLAQGLGDCDDNGVYDACQVNFGPDSDCDENGVVDTCELSPETDCDGNGILDVCEPDLDGDGITDACDDDADGDGWANDQDAFPMDASEWADLDNDGVGDNADDDIDGDGWANDQDAFPLDPAEWADSDSDGVGDNADDDDDNDGIADACDADDDPGADCDGNGMIDSCEMGPETDCDANGVLDVCQLDPMSDCNNNGVLDSCEIGPQTDCNQDGSLDACQLDAITDCNDDGILDSCQLDSTTDCDNNGILDVCQGDPADDCNQDGTPDVCQLDGTTDCNGNNILDVCETGWSDCDEDGVGDLCQIQNDPSLDCNEDAVLDSCQDITDFGDPSWSTERFFGDFDLSGLAVSFSDTDGDQIYTTCTIDTQNNWIVDPSGGTPLFLYDDDWTSVQLSFPFTFKGVVYNMMEVGSNGYITFGGQGDGTYAESLTSHFDRPRISGLFDDLNPMDNGEIRWGLAPEGNYIHVSWIDVAHYRVSQNDPLRTSSFQIVLYADGDIDMCWLSNEANSALVGLSGGTGQPPGFAETDLSNATDCVSRVPAGYGDCDGDGVVDNCQISPAGDPWWATEQFTSSFDLSGGVAQLTPTGNPTAPAWNLCTDTTGASAFITPTNGATLPAVDDDFTAIVFANVDPALSTFDFDYAGSTFTDCYVSTNGYLTFVSGDDTYSETLADHFNLVRISALFHDFDPSAGGYVHVGAGPAGSFVATWFQVPSYHNSSQISTAQIQLHPDGAITLVWLQVDAPNAIVGLSDGTGIPSGFAETDYSLAGDCQLYHALDDCNANGVHDAIEIALGCAMDADADGIPDECEGSKGGWDSVSCLGDSDGDRAIDIRDLIGLLQCWNSQSGQCLLSDMDGNGIVGPGDVLLLVQRLGTPCD